jgi:hypothetical protein
MRFAYDNLRIIAMNGGLIRQADQPLTIINKRLTVTLANKIHLSINIR